MIAMAAVKPKVKTERAIDSQVKMNVARVYGAGGSTVELGKSVLVCSFCPPEGPVEGSVRRGVVSELSAILNQS